MSERALSLLCLLRFLPLPLLRAAGRALGLLLWCTAGKRRRIVNINLKLCYPEKPQRARGRMARDHFVFVTQALLDRFWLWHAPVQTLKQRMKLSGDARALALITGALGHRAASHSTDIHEDLQVSQHAQDDAKAVRPLVIFAPHFVGLDAGWTVLGLHSARELTTIFTQQSSKALDTWVYAGRMRFGNTRLFRKVQGVAQIARALRRGALLYLLPDMDFGAQDAVFADFFGQTAATVTSLSRFAKLSNALVVSVVSEMTPHGYSVRVSPVWEQFPSEDVTKDTQRMNRELEQLIETMPAQYYWVHRRFKTRPEGARTLY